ncbi:MAG TPA: cell division protein FtsQ/DivIB [Usitatibacter sp.]
MSALPTPLRRRIVPVTAAIVAAAALAGGAWYGFDAISAQPIRNVVFAGDLRRIARSDLDAFARSVQGASSSGASLLAVREAARKIAWVREATVRRRFPDSVEITLEAHEPLARWTDSELVSARGDVFAADYEGFLPKFSGPEGSGARMAQEYPAIREALAPLASAITELRLSARGAWQVLLESGLTLDLGRGDTQPRLARFAAAWPQLASQGVETRHVDLRYANGFAVRRVAQARLAAKLVAKPASRSAPRKEKKR